MPQLCKIIIFLVVLTGCSGYRFKYKQNPFSLYGIDSIAVPMFVNQSTIAQVSGPLTREIVLLLNRYPALKVTAGSKQNVDAVLIGIIKSPNKKAQTVRATKFDLSSRVAETSTQPRSDFFIPTESEIDLSLNLILIKSPSATDLKLIHSALGKNATKVHPKVIFDKEIGIKEDFTREVFDISGETNMTQNVGLVTKTVKNMAQQFAINFKELVLDAY